MTDHTDEGLGVRDQRWLDTLTSGHGYPRALRAAFRAVPSSPRCKVCCSPFGGLGGKAFGLAGFRPSRKNPNICAVCCEKLPPGGAEIDIAVLFADMRGSTALGETMAPAAFANMLNRFYRAATSTLLRHDAFIDKLIGDEVMALFIPVIVGSEYRARAVDSALSLLAAVGYADGAPWLELGISVHSGVAFVGNVGSSDIGDFTALGDTVNTAARLQSFASPGEVIVSEEVFGSVAARFPDAEQRVLEIRGKAEPLKARVLSVSSRPAHAGAR